MGMVSNLITDMSLNAPFGARCFLTQHREPQQGIGAHSGLNAPFGARCFLTPLHHSGDNRAVVGLNAPFGARCFLTRIINAVIDHAA